MKRDWRRPEVLLPLAFLLAIVTGATVLSLPGVSREPVGPLEALFTATSAVCVTGLVVVDTGKDFTPAGQGVILALIQGGGLGIMTFSIFALVIAGRRVSLEQDAAIKEQFSTVERWSVGRLLIGIIAMTLLLEAAGYLFLRGPYGAEWPALFHSVSAFCNAGFSLDSDSLQGRGAGVRIPIVFLVVLGGLGFTTLRELTLALRPRKTARRRFSLHSRLVLVTSGLLLAGGTLSLWLTHGDLGQAFFLSVSSRTAGFDATPVGGLTAASLLVVILLMFIGASPGSTGGGIKTTTLALALLLARATLQGRDHVQVHGREIPHGLLRRALSVVICSLAVVFLGILLITLFEPDAPDRFLSLAFEVVSAFGTVGLSTGVTAGLTPASKLLLCVVMFVGRVGSLSLFLFLVRDPGPSRVRYAQEKVLVG